MCQFGNSSQILEELELSEAEAFIGYRAWYGTNPFNDKEKFLKSLNQNYNWLKEELNQGLPTRDNSEGIYSYNYYNNYKKNYNNDYYNYDYNYDCNNYYNNHYNNHYNYSYNNYDYDYKNDYSYNNDYYYYYIAGAIKLFGNVFKYKEGYRSSLAKPTQLVILQNKRWFEDIKTEKFANHFNDYVTKLAQEYNCTTVGYDDWLAQGKQ